MTLTPLDYAVMMLYFVGIVLLGNYFARHIKSTTDYFLAGKMLPFWAIGMSIVATDIGAVDFVGLTGQAYRYGVVVGNFDWIGSVPAMILAAMVFVPYYWRSGVFTIPEYLGRRYHDGVSAVNALVWLIFMSFSIGVTLWASAVLLSELLGWSIPTAIAITALFVGLITIRGGLSAVVYTEVVQMVVMFSGAIAILAISFFKVGGWEAMVQKIHALGPEYAQHLSLIQSPKSNTPYPWTGILFGLALVMAPAYFIANQTIVQRALGARDEWNAKAGVLFGAFLKMFIPVLVVFPGLFALALFPNQVADGDRVYPMMIRQLLPKGMAGLIFAGFFAGLMANLDSAINSVATVWTKDVYEKYLKKGAGDGHYLLVGRIFTAVVLVGAVATAPLTAKFPGMYVYLQTLLSFIQGPVLAILVMGMFWRRTTPWAGFWGLVGGLCLSATLYTFKRRFFTIEDPFLYIAWWSFLGASILTFVVTFFTKSQPEEKIRGLVYSQILHDKEIQAALHKQVKGDA